ncbi:MAG: glycoside hydrolase family 95 protein [Firmicutes bacterium]|nr:glycoside hydrolase family 95 protein [Bacillota bacterium]
MIQASRASARNLRLWYRNPAANWNEALPIGNGRLGGMIFGTVAQERIQLNEDSVWYGGYIDRNNPDALANLPKIRQLLFEGKIKEAERLSVLAFYGTPESQRPYQTLGDLTLEFDHGADSFAGYTRELDLQTAIGTVSYTSGGTHYIRRYFVSAASQVLVIRITADRPGRVSLTVNLRRYRYMDTVKAARPDTLAISGNGGEGGIRFGAMVRAIPEGGKAYIIGENLLVEHAGAVTLLLAARTTFRHPDYEAACLNDLDRASAKNYSELLENHLQDYQSFFNRMELELGPSPPEKENLPTDERLARLREGEEDIGLFSLYFQFGRYLLISCSRPGTLPATLQGIWNQDMLPPWDSKYTININTEMNYWPAEVCNLSELHLPLFDLIERMREHGRITARKMYNCRGFTAHHNTDIWADTAPQDIWIPATLWPMGAAWLCLHLWEHYEFTGDIDFLKKTYPVLKEAAEFFLDFLVEDSKGRLVTCPSVSPENTYRLPNGETGSICIGPSMDSQILYALFSDCIQASTILGLDPDFAAGLRSYRERLPRPEVGRYGQIQEWAEDYEEVDPGHRHISQLFALHPGNQITVRNTPELAIAARKTLERRLLHGSGHTGWSRAWIVNLFARLEDGEKAYENLAELLRKSTLPNLFDTHPPFQIDGNFGGTAGIAEMLLQSHAGEINLLPALPKAWAYGTVTGIRARGGVELDFQWRDHQLEKVRLKPFRNLNVAVRYREKTVRLDFEPGKVIQLDGELHPI